jgi:hypothetical protein
MTEPSRSTEMDFGMSALPTAVPAISQEDWLHREQIIEQFEKAFRNGRRPAIEEFLEADEGDPLILIEELIHTDLEFRLRSGEAIRVEKYFERFSAMASDPQKAAALIAAEYKFRHRQEPGITLEEYIRRFPQYLETIPHLLGPSHSGKRRKTAGNP